MKIIRDKNMSTEPERKISEVAKVKIYNSRYHNLTNYELFSWTFMLDNGCIFSSEVVTDGFATREECLQNMVQTAIALGVSKHSTLFEEKV